MIEEEMKSILLKAKLNHDNSLYHMLTYHLGWSGENRSSISQGKRIRPLLVLLSNAAVEGYWENVVPAAASIELIHNFSLIHDDIEDKSLERRGRKTLWAIHGIPLAINAGDALFSLSFIAITRLLNDYPADLCLKAFSLISNACLALTMGQHLDISFENSDKVSVENYIEMIRGKTAALLATSMELGALLSGINKEKQALYHQTGENIGLAFQVYDDILGIWGNVKKTGKSAATDILNRKKSLPILFGIAQEGLFMEMWHSDFPVERVAEMANQLKVEGAYDYAKTEAERYTQAALSAVEKANPSGPYADTFNQLIEFLTMREF
jgi:geranylgeranyl diphosphate synthase type I